jgi:uncharacterized phage protein (TIGR01671 family)
MNRQIKFRVFVSWLSKRIFEVEGMSFGSDGKPNCLRLFANEHHRHEIHDDLPSWRKEEPILMQFTGLLDCEGKEIWDGDVCQYAYKDRYGIDFDGVAYIYWDTSNCAFALKVIKDSRNDSKSKMSLFYAGGNLKLKIIGNRFEHPALLGAAND